MDGNVVLLYVQVTDFRQVLTRAVSRLARNEPVLTLELPGETVRVSLPVVVFVLV